MKQVACPYMSYAFEYLSKKWFGVILHTLYISENQELHFKELKKAIDGISPKILTIRLNESLDDGFIEKIDDEHFHVYRITKKGIELIQALEPLEGWSKKYSL